jgi:hypothetical protein
MQDWKKVAKQAYPSLKPARPQQFARVNDTVLIVLDEAPYVLVIQDRDLDKLSNIVRIVGSKPKVPLPEPPPV